MNDVDIDNDGLIDISNLDMLNNIRYNLAGTSYKTSGTDPGSSAGAPTVEQAGESGYMCNGRTAPNRLCGYELTKNLDFATAAHYVSGSVNNDWRPDNTDPDRATNAGFSGFGATTGTTGGFTAIFEGNSHTINNLYSRNISTSQADNVGLFRLLNSAAIIRNIGVTNVRVYGNNVGGLVGRVATSGTVSIRASHSTGTVKGIGGSGSSESIGGLVGYSSGTSRITASYSSALVTTTASDGSSIQIGGLLGYGSNITITASYATGNVTATGGSTLIYVGGLAGEAESSRIRASYATGNVTVMGGFLVDAGGLLGTEGTSGITRIIASYAAGDVVSSVSSHFRVGKLYGNGNAIQSYSFGSLTGGDPSTGGGGEDGDSLPDDVTSASALTADNAGSSWNSATDNTFGAWNFGTTSQNPALVYNDYDGATGTTFASCGTNNGGYPAKIPGSITSANPNGTTLMCGSTLVGDRPSTTTSP